MACSQTPFRKLKQPTIDLITSVEHYEASNDDPLSEIPGTVALFVHMWATKTELRNAFDKFLKKYHKGNPGRPEFDGMADFYNFCARPDTGMLKKTLAVYRAFNNPENKDMSYWQIEEEASKEFSIIDKTQNLSLYTFKWNQPLSAVSPDIIEKRRNYQCTIVIRYLKCAEEILDNVVEGRFPVYTINTIKEPTA